jgi:hypothetical protein
VWLLVRRPLLFLLVIGCTVSFLASSQLTARLIIDGAVSFAFVPVIQVAALAAILRWTPSRLRLADAVDRFFAGSTAWLVTLIAIGAAAAVTQPVFWSLTMLELAAVPALAASLLIDYRFFRDDMAHARPARAVTVQRLIAWPLTVAYFLGVPIWAEVLPHIPGWPIR